MTGGPTTNRRERRGRPDPFGSFDTGRRLESLQRAHTVYAHEGLRGLARASTAFAIRRPVVHPQLHWAIASAYYSRICANDVAAWPHGPDPFVLEWVDPDRIRRHTRREYPPYRDRLELFGAVRGGDWDRRTSPTVDPTYEGPPASLFLADEFEDSTLYRSLEARFNRAVPWSETELIRAATALLEADSPERVWHECTTMTEIRARCRHLDTLYEQIRTLGYRSERERIGVDPEIGFRHVMRNEITVDVGRDGELLLVAGKHRLAIAKLLDLEAVPVVFLVRHPEWMAHRERVATGEDQDTHPDCRALRS